MKQPRTQKNGLGGWKTCTWGDLDTLGVPDATLVSLRHNAEHIFEGYTKEGVSLKPLLLSLMQKGKREGNPKITGFIKTVEHTFVGRERLSSILEVQLATRQAEEARCGTGVRMWLGGASAPPPRL